MKRHSSNYLELKAWMKWFSWSDTAFSEKFVRDLINPKLSSLENLNWVFKKTDGITEKILKEKVIGALESKVGRESLKSAFEANKGHFKKLFGKDIEKC